MYALQKKIFKYYKPQELDVDKLFADEKTFKEYQQRLKIARDPRRPFNFVHRFP
jgi:hypothetical protein